MKFLCPSVALLTLAALSFAQDVSSTQNAPALAVKGSLDGPATEIFESMKNSCDSNDVPDAMARAFRDYTGTVHFSSASSQLFQSLGPTLETVVHSCAAAFSSANDTNPADFNDQVWLDSFYTFDGLNIAVLAHTEYHGWNIAGECHLKGNSRYNGGCEYDSDTYHISRDGGYTFVTPTPPGNFLAGFPYKYQVDRGPYGYSVDTNMIEYNGWIYAVATDYNWPPNCSGTTGPTRCRVPLGGAPLRTQNVFDPKSWRTWDGNNFTVAFDDPYLGTVRDQSKHIYVPVPYMEYVNAIGIYKPLNVVVATLWDYWDNTLGPPGMYLTTSTDMIHWSRPSLVVTTDELLSEDGPGSWTYAYFSLIDPDAEDLNFSTLGDHPYLYYVRLNNNNSSQRILYRRRITLSAAQ